MSLKLNPNTGRLYRGPNGRLCTTCCGITQPPNPRELPSCPHMTPSFYGDPPPRWIYASFFNNICCNTTIFGHSYPAVPNGLTLAMRRLIVYPCNWSSFCNPDGTPYEEGGGVCRRRRMDSSD